jgi:hypothetical protein
LPEKVRKVESVKIRRIILEDEFGARVVISLPDSVPAMQEGGVLRSLSMGAISTTALINDFKKSRLKARELREQGKDGISEMVHGSTQERLKPEDQVSAALATAGGQSPPVFVEDGKEDEICGCQKPLGNLRCFYCGKKMRPDVVGNSAKI